MITEDMRNVYFSVLLFLAFTIVSCNNHKANKKAQTNSDTTIQNSRKWLKEYALCSCIKYSFKNDTAIRNDLSFAVYKGISDYGSSNAYHTIDSLSENAALNIRPSQIADFNKRKALMTGCINFYESALLDSAVRSFDSVLIKAEK